MQSYMKRALGDASDVGVMHIYDAVLTGSMPTASKQVCSQVPCSHAIGIYRLHGYKGASQISDSQFIVSEAT